MHDPKYDELGNYDSSDMEDISFDDLDLEAYERYLPNDMESCQFLAFVETSPFASPVRDIELEVGANDSSSQTQWDPSLARNVALVGHLQHGKTTFMSMLVEESTFNLSGETDTGIDAQERRISTKPAPRRVSMKPASVPLLLEDSEANRYLCNVMDAPGHLIFPDEMIHDSMLADGLVLLVDAAEGVRVGTERAIRHAVQERLPIVVVITKVDRLVTELKLRPNDAYHKLRHIIEAINNHISAVSSTAGGIQTIDPAAGNVCFASANAGWSFTLHSFAKLYVELHKIPVCAANFASRLWGDTYYSPGDWSFTREPLPSGGDRAFVQLILEPLFKIYTQVMGENKKSLEATLAELGVNLGNAAYRLNVQQLLRLVCNSVFGSATGFTDMLVQRIPSAKDAAAREVGHIYAGPQDSSAFDAMRGSHFSEQLYPKSDCSVSDAFGLAMVVQQAEAIPQQIM